MSNQTITRITPGKAVIASSNVAVALSSGLQGCIKIDITALDTNAGPVYIGGPGITAAQGVQLSPTQKLTLDVDNVNKVYLIGAGVGDGVSFSYYN